MRKRTDNARYLLKRNSKKPLSISSRGIREFDDFLEQEPFVISALGVNGIGKSLILNALKFCLLKGKLSQEGTYFPAVDGDSTIGVRYDDRLLTLPNGKKVLLLDTEGCPKSCEFDLKARKMWQVASVISFIQIVVLSATTTPKGRKKLISNVKRSVTGDLLPQYIFAIRDVVEHEVKSINKELEGTFKVSENWYDIHKNEASSLSIPREEAKCVDVHDFLTKCFSNPRNRFKMAIEELVEHINAITKSEASGKKLIYRMNPVSAFLLFPQEGKEFQLSSETDYLLPWLKKKFVATEEEIKKAVENTSLAARLLFNPSNKADAAIKAMKDSKGKYTEESKIVTKLAHDRSDDGMYLLQKIFELFQREMLPTIKSCIQGKYGWLAGGLALQIAVTVLTLGVGGIVAGISTTGRVVEGVVLGTRIVGGAAAAAKAAHYIAQAQTAEESAPTSPSANDRLLALLDKEEEKNDYAVFKEFFDF